MSKQLRSAQRRSEAVLDAVKLASPASLNDCMMRNVYRYRYVVVIDFDEVIVPRSHGNYTQLMQHINREYSPQSQPHTYKFHNTYFFLDLTPDAQQPAHMRTASFRQHAPPSSIKASDCYTLRTFYSLLIIRQCNIIKSSKLEKALIVRNLYQAATGIGHVTIRFSICHFLLVVHWNRSLVSNRF